MFYREIMAFLGAFLVGVFLVSINPDFRISLFFISLFCVTGIFFLLFYKNKFFLYLGLLVLGLSLGFLRFSFAQNFEAQFFVKDNVGEYFELKGRVNSEPKEKFYGSQFIFKPDDFPIKNTQFLVRTTSKNIFLYDMVSLKGELSSVENFSTDSGREFNYIRHLQKDSVYGIFKNPNIENFGFVKKSLHRRLYLYKKKVVQNMYVYLPGKHAGLIAGVLLGEDGELEAEVEDSFRKAGLMHIVVLSGYNVSLVIAIVMALFAWLRKSLRAPFVLFTIVCFALLTGAGITVLRASLMAVFIVMAQVLDRKYHVERALILVCVFMVLWNPWLLVYDLSFQLSFLASYGLVVMYPYVEEKISFVPKFLSMRDSAAATISAQIFVVPLIMFSIGDFSLVSILVNTLVLFAVPISMILGAVYAIHALVALPEFFVEFVSWLLKFVLDFIFLLTDFFSSLPLASIKVPEFSWFILLIIYFFIFRWAFSLLSHKDE